MSRGVLFPNYRKIAWGVAGTLAGFAVIGAALVFILRDAPPADPLPPQARPDHAAIRRQLHEDAQRRLGSYHWVDRDAGVVGIPVDRAIELWLAERRKR